MQASQRFANLMAQFGMKVDKAKAEDKKKQTLVGRWLDLGDKYYTDIHGSIRRRHPKRDKTMSARQWRKMRHAQRLANREKQANAEG